MNQTNLLISANRTNRLV